MKENITGRLLSNLIYTFSLPYLFERLNKCLQHNINPNLNKCKFYRYNPLYYYLKKGYDSQLYLLSCKWSIQYADSNHCTEKTYLTKKKQKKKTKNFIAMTLNYL